MANTNDPSLKFTKYKKNTDISIYSNTLITRKVPINIVHVGKNIKQTLERVIASQIEGKCVVEGYIKPGSAKISTYSSGVLKADDIIFEVTFECLVCSPVEGMLINCIAKNITKMGIRAETNEVPSPVVIFISRDHHYNMEYFSTIKEEDDIQVRVIGQRFELNDKYISIIAEVVEPKTVVTKIAGPGPNANANASVAAGINSANASVAGPNAIIVGPGPNTNASIANKIKKPTLKPKLIISK